MGRSGSVTRGPPRTANDSATVVYAIVQTSKRAAVYRHAETGFCRTAPASIHAGCATESDNVAALALVDSVQEVRSPSRPEPPDGITLAMAVHHPWVSLVAHVVPLPQGRDLTPV